MPVRQELPEALRGLARRHAIRLDHESFHSDTGRLLTVLEHILKPGPRHPPGPRRRLLLLLVILVAGAIGILPLLWDSDCDVEGSSAETLMLTVPVTPDGERVLSGSEDGAVKVCGTWPPAPSSGPRPATSSHKVLLEGSSGTRFQQPDSTGRGTRHTPQTRRGSTS